MTHEHCPRLASCPCASTMGNSLLRELLDALDWAVPARPDAPREVWNEALRRVRRLSHNAQPDVTTEASHFDGYPATD